MASVPNINENIIIFMNDIGQSNNDWREIGQQTKQLLLFVNKNNNLAFEFCYYASVLRTHHIAIKNILIPFTNYNLFSSN